MSSGQLLPVLWRSAKTTLRAFWRITRQVFHEATGALFALFGAYGLLLAWRQWHSRPILWLTGLALGYALLMTAFAVGAFRRAKRLR
jgi:hypothetical protein